MGKKGIDAHTCGNYTYHLLIYLAPMGLIQTFQTRWAAV